MTTEVALQISEVTEGTINALSRWICDENMERQDLTVHHCINDQHFHKGLWELGINVVNWSGITGKEEEGDQDAMYQNIEKLQGLILFLVNEDRLSKEEKATLLRIRTDYELAEVKIVGAACDQSRVLTIRDCRVVNDKWMQFWFNENVDFHDHGLYDARESVKSVVDIMRRSEHMETLVATGVVGKRTEWILNDGKWRLRSFVMQRVGFVGGKNTITPATWSRHLGESKS